jgi:ribonuclease P protein component
MIGETKNKYTFGKDQKLKSLKEIEEIFTQGKSVFTYPIKLFYTIKPIAALSELKPPQVGVSVSKRKFKKAVDRNTIKRRMREAYRLNATPLKANNTININILFVYVGQIEEPYSKIERGVEQCLLLLIKHINQTWPNQ